MVRASHGMRPVADCQWSYVKKTTLLRAHLPCSGKLVHGGLRYLEYYEFRLVREALIEREAVIEFRQPHYLAHALCAAPQ